jgi:hypothetical protein
MSNILEADKMTLRNISLGIIVLVIFLTGCPNPANGNNGDKKAQKLTVGYMSNFMVDLNGATGLGIAKGSVFTGRNARAAINTAEKNYLVKTTVEYSHGAVEWNEVGLTNVTVQKTDH